MFRPDQLDVQGPTYQQFRNVLHIRNHNFHNRPSIRMKKGPYRRLSVQSKLQVFKQKSRAVDASVLQKESKDPTNCLNWIVWQLPVPQTGVPRLLWTPLRRPTGAKNGWTGPAFLPADVRNAEEVDFDATDEIELSKKKNYKVCMCL